MQQNLIVNFNASVADIQRYKSHFESLKPSNDRLSGDKVKNFLLMSNLPSAALLQIWNLADVDKDGQLSLNEFYIAMYLIDMRLKNYIIPSYLPQSFYDSAFNNEIKQTKFPEPNYMMTAYHNVTANIVTSSNFPELIQETISKYRQKFSFIDTNKYGKLSGDSLKNTLVQTGVGVAHLAKIWELSDLTKDGFLDSNEFCLAMHLIDGTKNGYLPPNTIPQSWMDKLFSNFGLNSSFKNEQKSFFALPKDGSVEKAQVILEQRRLELQKQMDAEMLERIRRENEEIDKKNKQIEEQLIQENNKKVFEFLGLKYQELNNKFLTNQNYMSNLYGNYQLEQRNCDILLKKFSELTEKNNNLTNESEKLTFNLNKIKVDVQEIIEKLNSQKNSRVNSTNIVNDNSNNLLFEKQNLSQELFSLKHDIDLLTMEYENAKFSVKSIEEQYELFKKAKKVSLDNSEPNVQYQSLIGPNKKETEKSNIFPDLTNTSIIKNTSSNQDFCSLFDKTLTLKNRDSSSLFNDQNYFASKIVDPFDIYVQKDPKQITSKNSATTLDAIKYPNNLDDLIFLSSDKSFTNVNSHKDIFCSNEDFFTGLNSKNNSADSFNHNQEIPVIIKPKSTNINRSKPTIITTLDNSSKSKSHVPSTSKLEMINMEKITKPSNKKNDNLTVQLPPKRPSSPIKYPVVPSRPKKKIDHNISLSTYNSSIESNLEDNIQQISQNILTFARNDSTSSFASCLSVTDNYKNTSVGKLDSSNSFSDSNLVSNLSYSSLDKSNQSTINKISSQSLLSVNYIQSVESVILSDNGLNTKHEKLLYKAVALYDYPASRDDELNVTKGDTLDVLEFIGVLPNGWVYCRSVDLKMGFLPLGYVSKLDSEGNADNDVTKKEVNYEEVLETNEDGLLVEVLEVIACKNFRSTDDPLFVFEKDQKLFVTHYVENYFYTEINEIGEWFHQSFVTFKSKNNNNNKFIKCSIRSVDSLNDDNNNVDENDEKISSDINLSTPSQRNSLVENINEEINSECQSNSCADDSESVILDSIKSRNRTLRLKHGQWHKEQFYSDNAYSVNDTIRQKAIDELIESEQNYIDDLNLILECFYNPFSESNLITKQDLSIIFMNIKSLILCNLPLLKSLTELKKSSNDGYIDKVGETILNYLPKSNEYSIFCSNQQTSEKHLAKLLKSVPKFRQLEQECLLNEKTLFKLPISSYLLKPLQRITKYPLLIKHIIKYTDKSHPDHPILQEAFKKADRICLSVNEAIDKQNNINLLEWLESNVYIASKLTKKLKDFESIVDLEIMKLKLVGSTQYCGQRLLIRYGIWNKINSATFYRAFLTNDLLFLLKFPSNAPKKLPYDHNDKNNQIRIHDVPLNLKKIQAIINQTVNDSLSIQLKDRIISFKLENTIERDQWVKDINKYSYNSKINQYNFLLQKIRERYSVQVDSVAFIHGILVNKWEYSKTPILNFKLDETLITLNTDSKSTPFLFHKKTYLPMKKYMTIDFFLIDERSIIPKETFKCSIRLEEDKFLNENVIQFNEPFISDDKYYPCNAEIFMKVSIFRRP